MPRRMNMQHRLLIAFFTSMRHGGAGGGSAWGGIKVSVEHLSRRAIAQAPARRGVDGAWR